MINHNGNFIKASEWCLSHQNRGFTYGDSLFETVKVLQGKVVFAEDHYLRLMASMRMIRMTIPMDFTPDFFIQQLLKTVVANQLSDARVRFTVVRKEGGLYQPKTNAIDYLITATALEDIKTTPYEVDIYKDHYLYSGMLSTLKSNNKLLNVIAGIYADENELQNCILVNEKKNIVEATNGNIFLVKGKTILTPAVSEGCLKGILRKKLIEFLEKAPDFEVVETEISPFELQKVDEVFITNVIRGIQSVTNYRKKEYQTEVGNYLALKIKELETS